MPDIQPRGDLSLYLDDIMNEYFDTEGQMSERMPQYGETPEQANADSFAQRFEGASPEEMLRQKFIQDLLQRHDDPVVYEELPPENRSRSIRSAHRV